MPLRAVSLLFVASMPLARIYVVDSRDEKNTCQLRVRTGADQLETQIADVLKPFLKRIKADLDTVGYTDSASDDVSLRVVFEGLQDCLESDDGDLTIVDVLPRTSSKRTAVQPPSKLSTPS